LTFDDAAAAAAAGDVDDDDDERNKLLTRDLHTGPVSFPDVSARFQRHNFGLDCDRGLNGLVAASIAISNVSSCLTLLIMPHDDDDDDLV